MIEGVEGVEGIDHLACVEADAAALARSARGRLDAPVPTCPDWTVTNLVRHIGGVHRWVIAIVSTRAQERVRFRDVVKVPRDDPLGWFAEGVPSLLQTLRQADPQERVWSWAGDHRVAFWRRRMAHETLIHRVDADLAADALQPIDPHLAADGVAEFLDIMLGSDGASLTGDGAVVALRQTDGAGRWAYAFGPRGLDINPEASASVTILGTSADLDLVLWRRRSLDGLEVDGDRALAERVLAQPQL